MCKIIYTKTSEQQCHLNPGRTFGEEYMIPQSFINVNIILTNTVQLLTNLKLKSEDVGFTENIQKEISD
jgi:hypothetical protein